MTDQEFFMQKVGDKGEGHTIGQYRDAIYRITEVEEAQRFFRGSVAWIAEQRKTHPEATSPPGMSDEQIARDNIGYLLGYLCGEEHTRKAKFWADACGAVHPIFGTKVPTPEEAFAAGQEWAKR